MPRLSADVRTTSVHPAAQERWPHLAAFSVKKIAPGCSRTRPCLRVGLSMPSFCLRLLAAVLAAYRASCSTGPPIAPTRQAASLTQLIARRLTFGRDAEDLQTAPRNNPAAARVIPCLPITHHPRVTVVFVGDATRRRTFFLPDEPT
jgi:hypothetical protein